MPTFVAIAENHHMTRWGIRSVIEGCEDPALRIVSSAETGLQTVSMAEQYEPDVLVLSLRLPHLNGLDVLYYLQQRSLSVRSLVLTGCTEAHRARRAFERGADAYVLKRDSTDELCTALSAVRRGDQYLSDAVPSSCMVAERRPDSSKSDPFHLLTIREREVAQMTAEGYTSREIGEQLSISPRTVEKHRENAKSTLGVRSVVEMAYYAYRRGFLPSLRTLRANATP